MRVTTVTMRRHGLAHTENITHGTRTRLVIASWCAHTTTIARSRQTYYYHQYNKDIESEIERLIETYRDAER